VTEGELEMSGGLILKGSTIAIGNVRQAQLFIACPFLLPCGVWSVITEVLVCGAVLSFLLCKSQFLSSLQGFVDLRTLLSEAMGPNAHPVSPLRGSATGPKVVPCPDIDEWRRLYVEGCAAPTRQRAQASLNSHVEQFCSGPTM
jgi:hypothetical protein